MSCEFVIDAEYGSRKRQELRHDEEYVSGDIMVFTYQKRSERKSYGGGKRGHRHALFYDTTLSHLR